MKIRFGNIFYDKDDREVFMIVEKYQAGLWSIRSIARPPLSLGTTIRDVKKNYFLNLRFQALKKL